MHLLLILPGIGEAKDEAYVRLLVRGGFYRRFSKIKGAVCFEHRAMLCFCDAKLGRLPLGENFAPSTDLLS
jgi:hypothetical protein